MNFNFMPELPELPKFYNRKEEKVDGKIAQWFFKNYPSNFTLEIKVDNNKALPHQITALNQVHNGIFLYKIPDMGRKNPFDYIGIKQSDSVHAFVVTYNTKTKTCTAVRTGTNESFVFKL